MGGLGGFFGSSPFSFSYKIQGLLDLLSNFTILGLIQYILKVA